MKVRFYLKGTSTKSSSAKSGAKRKAKETYIELRASYDGYILIRSTGIRTNGKNWDVVAKRFKTQSLEQHHNEYLSFFETELTSLYIKNSKEGVVLPPKEFWEQFEEHRARNSKTEKTMLEYFEQDFIEARSVKATAADRVAGSTVQRYRVVIQHLKIYQEARKVTLTFSSMTKSFYNDYVNFFAEEYSFKRNGETVVGLNDSTIGNSVKTLVTFLGWAYEEGHLLIQDYKSFKVFKPVNDSVITLTDEEIDLIRNVDLSSCKNLEKARDILLFGLSVGARISDLQRLTDKNLVFKDGNFFIEYEAKKTQRYRSKPASAPIYDEALNIIKKYRGQYETLLPEISSVTLNKDLKKLGRLAKINDKIEKRAIRGNKSVVIATVPKWKLISTHIMRRSNVTLALKAGIPALLIMSCTGHSDFKSFQRYVDMSDDKYKAETMKKMHSNKLITNDLQLKQA